jgi:hypothetical protein
MERKTSEELMETYGRAGCLTLYKMGEAAEMEPHEAAAEFERLKADVEALAQANISHELLLLVCLDLALLSVLGRRGDIGAAGLFDSFLRELD